MRNPDEHPVASPAASRVAPLIALTLAAALLRFPFLTAEGLWFDEIFSVVLAAQEVPELLRRAVGDQTNPPGFYLLLWGWVRLGGFGEGWMRALPALAGVLTPAATWWLAHELGRDRRTCALAGLLAVTSPLLLAMSLEVRAYAPLALLATVGFALTARVLRADPPAAYREQREHRERRDLVALAVVNVAMIALHYFGALAVLAQLLASLVVGATRWRSRAPRLVLAATPAALVLGAWAVALFRATPADGFATNAAWIPTPGAAAVPAFAVHVVGAFDNAVLAWFVTAMIAVALMAVARHALGVATVERDAARITLTAALLPVLLVALISLLSTRSLWVPRSLIVVVPPLLLVLAMAAVAPRRPARTAAIVLLAGWATLAGVHSIGARARKPDWAGIVEPLAAAVPATICVNEPFVGLPLEYYALRRGLAVRVRDMQDCAPGPGLHWAVYRPETEHSLNTLVARGARLGPQFSLVTDLPPTVARPIDWPR